MDSRQCSRLFMSSSSSLSRCSSSTWCRCCGPGDWSLRAFIAPIRRFLDAYTEMISDLALLLATLSIMTGALVITGVPTKLGSLLIDAAGINLAAMVALSFIFGALLGTGLPPAPTYILVAIVIAPPMIQGRRQPVGRAFLRFLPRRLRRADAADFAGRRYHREDRQRLILRDIKQGAADLYFAVHADGRRICPARTGHRAGNCQSARGCLSWLPTLGITFSMQALCRPRARPTLAVRGALAAAALTGLLVPNDTVSVFACFAVLAAIGYWLVERAP